MNKIAVKINNNEYIMTGEESIEYLVKVSEYVDQKMKEIIDVNPKLSTSMAAVLTALNVADDYFKCNEGKNKEESEQLEEAKILLERFDNELKKLREENTDLKEESETLKEENELLKNEENEMQKSDLEEEMIKLKEDMNMILKEKDAKLSEAEDMISSFQNKIYELQMKIVELEK
ncbi:MAG: cell division protein ZapA [Peptostreptococcaceae bacterium]|jgi:cell division protein ZapA|nr:cell division protein ZapA [Peptostreptococcaceae bacterium]